MAAGLAALVCPAAARAQNAIEAENARPGTSAWAEPELSTAEGYATPASVGPGETIAFHISAPSGVDYRLDVYRLGWYAGSGGRLVTCLPSCSSTSAGQMRPVPAPDPATGEVRAAWPVSNTLTVPASWVTGYYLARIVLSDGSARGSIAFVVRPAAPPATQSPVLVQVPVNTWQAYNAWGGKSLYDFNSSGGRANRVSFERPYLWFPFPGAQALTAWELALVRFLERDGVDVSYVTDADVDRDPGVLLRHRVVLTAGHAEYWTKAIRDAFTDARANGTNLAFMGANVGYWQVRYENERSTLVGYKSTADPEPDPALETIRFRDLTPPRPECELLGVQHYEGSYNWPRADFVVGTLPPLWAAGTNLAAGSVITRVVSREHDLIPPGGCGVTATVAFSHAAVNDPLERAESVGYTAGSGARVFSTASLEWSFALDDLRFNGDGVEVPVDPRLQQLTRNILADFVRPAAPASVRTELAGRLKVKVVITRRPDPRVERIVVFRRAGGQAPPLVDPSWQEFCSTSESSCTRRVPKPGVYRFAAVALDRWGRSLATVTPFARRVPRR